MLGWKHRGGFCLNAEVWVAPWDRPGLERLLRYCARPIFAGERLVWVEPDERLVYHLPKPRPDGQPMLYLTPLEFLDRLANLVPPPREHRHRYHGVLAPHSSLRSAVTAYAGLPLDGPAPPATPPAKPPAEAEPKPASLAAYLWAALLARIYAVLPLICPACGSPMQLIAAVNEREPVQRILLHIGEPALAPPVSPARSPPEEQAFDWDQTVGESRGQGELLFEPPPEFEFDQTVSWQPDCFQHPTPTRSSSPAETLLRRPQSRPYPKTVADASGRHTFPFRGLEWSPGSFSDQPK